MVYLFFGENSFEVERRVKELVTSFEGDVEKCDGAELAPEQLPDLLAGQTLFSSTRCIVIHSASQNKPLWTALGEWFEKGIENDIVLVEANPDKRTKTYKWLEKHAKTTFAKGLQPFEAARWVKEAGADLGMTSDDAEFFVTYVGTDQWRLASELEKLRLTGKTVSKDLIQQVTEPTPQASVFELLDAAFRGRVEELRDLFELVAKKEDPYMFFGLVAGQLYGLALMKHASSKNADVVAKESGVHPFVLKKVMGLAREFTKGEVKELMERLAELDANMKSRPVDPWTQLHSFLKSIPAKSRP